MHTLKEEIIDQLNCFIYPTGNEAKRQPLLFTLKQTYSNGCEVPPTQNRKTFLRVVLTQFEISRLYTRYLETKFPHVKPFDISNWINFQVLCYPDHFYEKMDSDNTIHMLLPKARKKVNEYLHAKRAQTLDGVAELLYNHFECFDDHFSKHLESITPPKSNVEPTIVKPVERVKKPWWRFIV